MNECTQGLYPVSIGDNGTGAGKVDFYGHRAPVTVVCVNPYDPNEIASGSDDHTVKIWRLDLKECIQTIRFDRSVMGLKWRKQKGKILVVLSSGNIVSMDLCPDAKVRRA